MSKLASSERAGLESGSIGESMVWLVTRVVVVVVVVVVVAVSGAMVLASDSASDMLFRVRMVVKKEKRTVNGDE